MKLQRSQTIRAARLGAVSLCCAGALYLAIDTMLRSETGSGGWGYRGNQRANGRGDAQNVAIPVDRALLGSLPPNWQAEWRGSLLWITHYNPNGTVADCLPFNGLEDYHNWVYAHPDFCDVDAKKLARHGP